VKKKPSLSPKQKATLFIIAKMMRTTGMTPTQRELVVVLGITQNAVRDRLAALSAKGYIRLLPRVARGIVLVEHRKSA